jgi:hypothetical protein
MAVDNRQQSQLTGMGYDSMRYPAPHFTNPWVSAPAAPQQLYPSALAPVSSGLEQPQQRPTSIAIPYHSLPVTAAPLGQDLISRSYTGGYATSAPSNAQTINSQPQAQRSSFSDAVAPLRGSVIARRVMCWCRPRTALYARTLA